MFLLSFAALPAHADHIHQLYYNNVQWVDQDLTALTGATPPNSSTGIAAFYTTPNHQFHIYYATTDLHVHQLYYKNTNWSDEDPTAVTNGEWADRGWWTGFATGNQQHLFFPAFNAHDKRHLNQLYYNNSRWVDQDLSARVHGFPLSPEAGITAFAVTAGHLEAYCVTNDMDVHQFTLKDNTWTDEDLTALTGDPLDFSINGMVAFKTTPNNQFHLYYPPNDLYQIYFNGSSWSDDDLTSLTGGGIPNGSGGMAGIAISNLQHVFYVAQ